MDKVDALAKYFGINRSDLIEERKNNTSISSFIQCQTKDEETLVLSYRELNDINKKKVSHTQTISYQLNVWKTNSAPLTPALI